MPPFAICAMDTIWLKNKNATNKISGDFEIKSFIG
jgi:hypothetical protein